jgi:hypothetical protein
VNEDLHLEIHDFILSKTKKLINDCLKYEFFDQPLFKKIVSQLETMQFKLAENMNSSKLLEFVKNCQKTKVILT